MKTMLQTVLLTTVAMAFPLAGNAAPARKPAATAAKSKPEAPPAAPVAASTLSTKQPRLLEREVTLAELGFADGLSFNGFSGQRDLFFPVPAGVPVSSLRLSGVLDSAIPDPIRASAQIAIDNRPRWSGVLGTAVVPVALEVARGDQTQDYVRVGFRYGAAWTDDRCADQRLPGGYVTLAPETALLYSYDPAAITSLRTAMAVLPRHVRIALSAAPLSRDHYEAALVLAAELGRQGHKVSFLRLPATVPVEPEQALAEIVIAPAAELAALKGDGQGTARLLRNGRFPLVALTDGANAQTALYLSSDWQALAGGPAVTPRASRPVMQTDSDAIAFARLGLGQGVQEVVDRGEWQLRLDYAMVPKDMRPAALRIELAPGAAMTSQPQLAHIFVNDLLLRSVTLEGGAQARTLKVPLPDGLLGRSNAVRVVLQRQPAAGNCKDAPLASPAQLLPGSAVELVADKSEPADFFALGSAFADGVTVVVPPAALADPAASLALAAKALSGLSHNSQGLQVVLDDGKVPTRPFLLLPGAKLPAGISLPVAMEEGSVKVVDRQKRLLLDVSGTPGLLVAQLATVGDQPGLILQSGGSGPIPVPAALALDRGNVAFADATGLLMSLDTLRERAVRVEVGEASAWADWVDRFRILLVAGVWVALTAALAGVAARWYRSRSKPKV
ncbi:hypothetical protein GE253_04060 [Niveispirillum sp. SYP-B3756]|uniref:hypothetical protein n=1 Tax=Niveispirillum sp. SYP-B3756 TaxID=2662178 RepID=UPI00129216F6|nr:hypothetical protein [Niveispirillum sp. SYP-B3756]MQP64514.1 hypothetical protein [Niveispirillum sp. SYP-B3756]